MINKNKKAAIELSIGTIVIIVLAMSMLILGIVLVKSIFTGSIEIATMTQDQVKNQISQMFGEDKKLVMYPNTREVKITPGETSAFLFGIKNLLKGTSAQGTSFSYEVVISDPDLQKKCGVNENTVQQWITAGRAENLGELAAGEIYPGKVIIEIPEGENYCTFRLRVNVRQNNQAYASDSMDVILEP